MPKEKPVIREFFMDDVGTNKVISYHFDKRVILYLKLKSETKKRKIGVITKSTRTMQVTRNLERHLFQKTFSWGFNDYILRNKTLFDKIWLKDNGGYEWVIPVDYILEHGHYLHFQNQGFERQIFIKLLEIEQFKVKEEEKRRF
jgi:hypothetical protein